MSTYDELKREMETLTNDELIAIAHTPFMFNDKCPPETRRFVLEKETAANEILASRGGTDKRHVGPSLSLNHG